MDYQKWLKYKSRLAGRDISLDERDYDLEGYYNTQNFTPIDPENGHLPDDFKKPNHPTFSNQSKYSVPVIQQGGSWSEDGIFTPSELNLSNMNKDNMQKYFNEVENPEALNLPNNEKFSKIKKIVKK